MSKHRTYRLIGVIFYCIQHIFAATVIDIDTTDVFTKQDKTTGHQLRMVTYDVEKQQFLKVEYFFSGKKPSVISSDITQQGFSIEYSQSANGGNDNFPLTIKINDCKIDTNIWLLLPSYAAVTFSPECSSTKTHEALEFSQDTVRAGRKLVRRKDTIHRKPGTLYAFLGSFSINPHGNPFMFSLYSDLKDLTVSQPHTPIREDSLLDKSEKGKLGEIATDATFFVYGFTKLISKLNGGSDNGIDGVFVDDSKTPTLLYVTESKFRREAFSKDAFIKEVGIESIKRKIKDAYTAHSTGIFLSKALAGGYLHIAGQCFLECGRMKSPYLYSPSHKKPEPTYERLQQILTELKDKKFNNNATALAKALNNLPARNLQLFLNADADKVPKSTQIMKNFMDYICQPENETLLYELFPEKEIPGSPETLTLSSRFAGAYSTDGERFLRDNGASDAMVGVFKTIYTTNESFNEFLRLFSKVQVVPVANEKDGE
jgi:hypothetical protein